MDLLRQDPKKVNHEQLQLEEIWASKSIAGQIRLQTQQQKSTACGNSHAEGSLFGTDKATLKASSLKQPSPKQEADVRPLQRQEGKSGHRKQLLVAGLKCTAANRCKRRVGITSAWAPTRAFTVSEQDPAKAANVSDQAREPLGALEENAVPVNATSSTGDCRQMPEPQGETGLI